MGIRRPARFRSAGTVGGVVQFHPGVRAAQSRRLRTTPADGM